MAFGKIWTSRYRCSLSGTIRFLSLLAIISTVSSSTSHNNVLSTSRVSGGYDAKSGDHPSFVIIRSIKKVNELAVLINCAGTILDEYNVISAAHCFPDISSVSLKPIDIHYEPGEKLNYSAEKLCISDIYDHDTFFNDVAIVKLKKPITLGEKVKAIKLPTGPVSKNYQSIKVIGFGRTGPDEYPTTLQELPIKQVRCSFSPFNQNATCFKHRYDKYTGSACPGDSGGPVLGKLSNGSNEDVLVGIISHSDLVCRKGDPGYFGATDAWVIRDQIDALLAECNPPTPKND